ncbi:hypothetical protein EVAR_6023_1 [Eumeta japonica]|uniref:Uncharacterized protein n=1 Tax=Eumeta variegata TaxID=151549 RepID=A0A4C1T9J8_EUMVA|nr:hypothetical protein EVAR_6023_1 [Eumeta japonica]
MVETECGVGIGIKCVTAIGIENEFEIKIDIDRYKRCKEFIVSMLPKLRALTLNSTHEKDRRETYSIKSRSRCFQANAVRATANESISDMRRHLPKVMGNFSDEAIVTLAEHPKPKAMYYREICISTVPYYNARRVARSEYLCIRHLTAVLELKAEQIAHFRVETESEIVNGIEDQ